MLNLSKNHQQLSLVSFGLFTVLSLLIAVFPAANMQNNVQPLSKANDLSTEERNGLKIYISEGCVACHTQQVRNIEMDRVWGGRPSIPSDYYYSKQRMDFWRQTPSLLGSERTGPDLTNVGFRQPSEDWHLLHLYNPRIVVKESIMPAYPWLFRDKYARHVTEEEIVVNVPQKFRKDSTKTVIASKRAMDLVAYLKSLKQVDPSFAIDDFIPSEAEEPFQENSAKIELDGKTLYIKNCAACHQPSGEGLAGAFPPLKGSSIVLNENYDLMIQIILQGYDARKEYGVMPALGAQLTDEEIAAIVNYEKNSWGNEATRISKKDVKRVRDYVEALSQ